MDRRFWLTFATLSGLFLVFFSVIFALKSKMKRISDSPSTRMRFNHNHEFVILHITDLHYGEKESYDRANDEIQEKLIGLIKPDMIVNTGDAISGYAWDKSSKFYEKNWKRFTNAYLKSKTYYAYALGNHDIEADATLDEIAALERTHSYSLFNGTKEIDPLSLSNYLVHLYSSFEGHEQDIVALIWIFDSKKKCDDTSNGNGCINQNQLAWFESLSAKHLRKDKKLIEGMSFFHVPIYEFMYVWNDGMTFGIKDEAVSCPIRNTRVFDSFKKTGNIRVVGCGHDHNNNYFGNWKGIDLIYGQKTGYGSYGPSKTQRGARVYKLRESIDEDGFITWDYSTYIVYEDGTIQNPSTPVWQGAYMSQLKCGSDYMEKDDE